MSKLYETIEGLCRRDGVSVTEMCKASGASRASLTDLKMGRKQSLSAATLSKIGRYFGVSLDALLGNEAPPPSALPFDDELIAFYGECKPYLDESDVEDLKLFMKMKAERKRRTIEK